MRGVSAPTVAIPSRHRLSCVVLSLSPFSYALSRSRALSTARARPSVGSDHYQLKATKYWNDFYKRHYNKFFKDRHYLQKDWEHYFSVNPKSQNSSKVVLEVGCGAGNAIFPLIAAFPHLFIHACDFSPNAIALVQIFTLSAVSPEKMSLVLQNIKKVLKPSGYVLFRDYATGDYAQEKLAARHQMIGENFYVRGDGTCVFYFSEDFLSSLFRRAGFNDVEINVYYRQIENHSCNIVMNRRWMRGVFCNSDYSTLQPISISAPRC